MESTNIEGLQDKQNSKNTGGIMRYQLRNFQLFLVVFLTGSSGNVFPYRDKFDPIWNGIKYSCKITEITVGVFKPLLKITAIPLLWYLFFQTSKFIHKFYRLNYGRNMGQNEGAIYYEFTTSYFERLLKHPNVGKPLSILGMKEFGC